MPELKRMVLLKRRVDLSLDQFFAYWAGPHARVASRLPGVSKYTQNQVQECLWMDGGPAVDGIVELWFRDQESMERAASSDVGRTLIPEDERRFLSGITLVNVKPDAGKAGHGAATKVILVGEAKGGGFDARSLAGGEAAAWLASDVQMAERVYGRDGLLLQQEISRLVNLWFESAESARGFFARRSTRDVLREQLRTSAAYLVTPLQII